jgi:hypothetical protein
MFASISVFLNFNLPNATTWFYFSFLLAVALFFKFSRLLSVRNWDVVFLFLLTPGLLLIQPDPQSAVKIAAFVAQAAEPAAGTTKVLAPVDSLLADPLGFLSVNWLWFGYLWLLCGSAYFFMRCLFDLALVQRPSLAPNLSFGGMAWLASALFVCLLAVAFRQPSGSQPLPERPMPEGVQSAVGPVGRETAAQALAREWFDAPDWMRRSFAGLCHLAVIIGLVLIAHLHFRDASAGMAAATFYLMLPYTGLYVSQVHHVWPVVLIVGAILAYRLPTLAGCLLGVAAGTAYFPMLVFPVWLSFYWKRGAGRFSLAFLLSGCLCLGALGLDLAMKGELEPSIHDVLAQNAWQPWKVPTTEGFWTGMHWAYRIPVFLAYLAFVLATAFWPFPKNLAQLISLSAAVIIGIQLWYADKGGVFVLWYLPLILLLVFRPNLADRRPDPIQPELDWLCRARHSLRTALRWLIHVMLPSKEEPATK